MNELDDKIKKIIEDPSNKKKHFYINNKVIINRSIVSLFSGGRIIAILLILCGAYLFHEHIKYKTINTVEADELKELVVEVASCEGKTPQKLYGEIKKTYNVYNIKKVNQLNLRQIKEDLTKRKCENDNK